MTLQGRVAAVTGASRGIGKAIAEALAGEGMRLVLNGLDEERLAKAAQSLRAETRTVAGDAGDEAVAERIVGTAVEAWGRLDVLVNNAGIGHHATLEEMEIAAFDRLVRTNLRGPFLLMRAAIPQMKRQGGGMIINVASLAAVNPVPRLSVYAATKWALLGLSRSVMPEVRRDGIRILVVEPGSTFTDFGHGDAKLAKAEKLVQPEDVAGIVLAALKLPARATVSEIEIRPTDPP